MHSTSLRMEKVKKYKDTSLQEEAVGVQAHAHKIDADVADPDNWEAEGTNLRAVARVPTEHETGVQVASVHKQDDKGPSLLRIPAPVAAPRLVGPNSAGDDAKSQEAEAQQERSVRQVIQRKGKLV